jgi:hypothetical protein
MTGVASSCPQNSRGLTSGISRLEDCVCSPGYYGYALLKPSPCAICPANSYCPGQAANQSTQCPNGKYALGGSSADSACFCPEHASSGTGMTTVGFCNCDKDYLRVANASSPLAGFSCVPCPLGQICFNGTNSSCPPYSYAPGKVATFMDCACLPGYYNTSVQNASSLCQICDPKFYCPGGGLDKVACPDALQLSPAPATNVSACYCKSGYYGIGTLGCTICPQAHHCALGIKNPCPQNPNSP